MDDLYKPSNDSLKAPAKHSKPIISNIITSLLSLSSAMIYWQLYRAVPAFQELFKKFGTDKVKIVELLTSNLPLLLFASVFSLVFIARWFFSHKFERLLQFLFFTCILNAALSVFFYLYFHLSVFDVFQGVGEGQ